MNIRIDTPDAHLNGLFFRTADRMRVDGCVNALAQEGLSLALSSVSEALLDHYVQIMLQRLRASAPELAVEVYFPANTESLIARFNEVLARQSVRDATRNKNDTSPAQVWLVHDAQQLPDQELQLLARLIQNFPGANIRAILLMVGQAPTQESLSPSGRKLLRWDLETPSEEQIDATLETARHQGQADSLELLIRRMGKKRQAAAVWNNEVPAAPALTVPTPAPAPETTPTRIPLVQRLAAAQAHLQRWTQRRMPSRAPTPSAAPRLPLPGPLLETLRQRGPMLGVAAVALALSVLIMMWLQPAAFGLRGTKRAAAENTAAVSAPTTPATAAATAPTSGAPAAITSVTTPPPSNIPADVPDPAADAQAWVRSLPNTSFLIQHGLMATYEKAEQMQKAYGSLQEARIVAAYRPGESLAHFVVVSGPYPSAGKAYERIGRKDLPNTSWVRTTSSLQQQVSTPAQAKEKR